VYARSLHRNIILPRTTSTRRSSSNNNNTTALVLPYPPKCGRQNTRRKKYSSTARFRVFIFTRSIKKKKISSMWNVSAETTIIQWKDHYSWPAYCWSLLSGGYPRTQDGKRTCDRKYRLFEVSFVFVSFSFFFCFFSLSLSLSLSLG